MMNRRLRLALRKPRKMTTHYYRRRAARLFSSAVNKMGNEIMFDKLSKHGMGPLGDLFSLEDLNGVRMLDIHAIAQRAQRIKLKREQAQQA